MKTHRIITQICILSAVAAVAIPGSAQASSLLSGYGGPGQGNQAVLGSALLKGPKGGSGGSSGSSDSLGGGSSGSSNSSDSSGNSSSGSGVEGSSTPSASAGRGSGTSSGHAGGSSGNGSRSVGSNRSGSSSSRRSGQTGNGQARQRATASAQSFYPAAERVPSGQQGGVLGLSATNLLYVILAVAALALLAVLTRRLGETSPRESTGG
jgi:hypothetical protein